MDKRYAIGNFIYELRQQKGLTQKQLGDMLGVTNKAVSKWETGAAVPRIGYLHDLSAILGCTEEELFLGCRTGGDEPGPSITAQESYVSVVKRCDACRHEAKPEGRAFEKKLICQKCGAELKATAGWTAAVIAAASIILLAAAVCTVIISNDLLIVNFYAQGFPNMEEAAFHNSLLEHFPKIKTIGLLAECFIFAACISAAFLLIFLLVFLLRKCIRYKVIRYPHAEDGKIVL